MAQDNLLGRLGTAYCSGYELHLWYSGNKDAVDAGICVVYHS